MDCFIKGILKCFWQVLLPTLIALGGTRVLAKKLKSYPGLYVLIAKFYQSLQRDQQPPVTGQEGREVVRVMEMIRSKAQAEGIRSLQ